MCLWADFINNSSEDKYAFEMMTLKRACSSTLASVELSNSDFHSVSSYHRNFLAINEVDAISLSPSKCKRIRLDGIQDDDLKKKKVR